jgi:hypothetical protein
LQMSHFFVKLATTSVFTASGSTSITVEACAQKHVYTLHWPIFLFVAPRYASITERKLPRNPHGTREIDTHLLCVCSSRRRAHVCIPATQVAPFAPNRYFLCVPSVCGLHMSMRTVL